MQQLWWIKAQSVGWFPKQKYTEFVSDSKTKHSSNNLELFREKDGLVQCHWTWI